MSEKVNKMPSILSLKRWNSKKEPTTSTNMVSSSATKVGVVGNSVRFRSSESQPRKLSAGGIKELVQCPLCLEVLYNPKMLPCQHTFCLACLIVYAADSVIIGCPICNEQIQIPHDTFVSDLPSNLYIDSLLELVGKNEEPPPIPPPPKAPESVELFAGGIRCNQCHSTCDNSDVTSCQHCKLKFCRVCWSQHLDDMQTQIGAILKQLDSAAKRLDHKIENYTDRVEHLSKQINQAAEDKIQAIIETKEELLKDANELHKSGEDTALNLKTALTDARHETTKAINNHKDLKESDRVTAFMNVHQHALQILSEVSKWDTESFIFDKENFCIELDTATSNDAETDDPLPGEIKQNDPLKNEYSMVNHYRTRNFIPQHVWRKTPRPTGIGVSPWNNHIYVCGGDAHSLILLERTQGKVVTKITSEEMMFPVHIAFMMSLGEIYVTDKWKHCIHVFNKEGEYQKAIGQKGSRNGMFRSPEGIATDNAQQHIYVADTGNDRVQILQPDGKYVDSLGVATKVQALDALTTVWQRKEINCTEFNGPTSVAITNDRVVVLDSGNLRVKVYNKNDRTKLFEFGSLGERKGQFKHPEVLTVDPLGFILVGDSGNSRVQVFKPNGQLVRVFGGVGTEPGRFGWISGIHITDELDIIVSDTKNHIVSIFRYL